MDSTSTLLARAKSGVLLFATDIVAGLENDRWPRGIEAHAAWIAPLGDGIEVLLKYSSHYINVGAKIRSIGQSKDTSVMLARRLPNWGPFFRRPSQRWDCPPALPS